MSVRVAASAGFCFGVDRAVGLVEQTVREGKRAVTLGPIIHNHHVVQHFAALGVREIASPEEVPGGSAVIIRSHGVSRAVYEALQARGLEIIDATCPFVSRIHRIVQEAEANGRQPLIIGTPEHPEVVAIAGWCRHPLVFPDGEALQKWLDDDPKRHDLPFTMVSQTTSTQFLWDSCKKIAKKVCTNLEFFDTICKVTEERQKEVVRLAQTSDGMLVVGGAHSSNTQKLYALAAAVCPTVRHIEDACQLTEEELRRFSVCKTIAIAAGASTPPGIIQEVKKRMAENLREECSFEELLEQSFKTLNTGERVTGVILAVNPAEIKVDLGTKHTGILPYDEITTESGVVLADEYHVGDPIEVVCTKFNDSEGTVLLSKKRLDISKHLAEIQAAVESGETLNGTVKEITRGGVVVQVKTATVFVPASQCGLPKDADLSELKNKKVPLKILEYNEQRRRAVGSIRNALRAQHKQEVEAFYATLEPGQKFKGTVRSLTSFGAFVNIGPVDGMIHITELSWGRLKQPSEVLKVGQTVDVFIKAVDPEKKRISLGYKTEENNPWNIFLKTYNVGDVITVTVVSLMPFGAFAEIMPGVDGLIHNSQISDKMVSNPASVLKVGDKVEVKIIAVDADKNRISLSIRAAADPDYVAPEPPKAKEAPAEKAEEAPAETAAEEAEEAPTEAADEA